MILDLSDILKNPGSRLAVDCSVDLGKEDFSKLGVVFTKPVLVQGEVKNTGGVIQLTAHAQGEYRTSCDRCGDPLSVPLVFSIEEEYVKEEGVANEGDAVILEKDSIAFDQLVAEHAFMAVPMKHLCKEDCKGVCQQCGVNLNHGQCDCTDDQWDPRFDILKGLFD